MLCLQDMNDSQSNFSESSMFDGLEGATGGSDVENSTSNPKFNEIKQNFASGYGYGEYGYAYGGNKLNVNESQSSNSSDEDYKPFKPADMKHVRHNHTYGLKPGQLPREKKSKEEEAQRKMFSRDEKRAKSMKVPFSTEDIIHSPVDRFNEMLQKYQLTDSQLALIRDIRRRGKNKVAAQNCRKRKMEVVDTIEDEILALKAEKNRLMSEHHLIDKEVADFRHKMSQLYQEVFASLRDDDGHPYDPNEYSLQQTADGNVFIVPRNSSSAETNTRAKSSSKKRKGKKGH